MPNIAQKSKNVWNQSKTSPIWGATIPLSIIMNFGLFDGPANIISCTIS
jgi:hypothetical protein